MFCPVLLQLMSKLLVVCAAGSEVINYLNVDHRQCIMFCVEGCNKIHRQISRLHQIFVKTD